MADEVPTHEIEHRDRVSRAGHSMGDRCLAQIVAVALRLGVWARAQDFEEAIAVSKHEGAGGAARTCSKFEHNEDADRCCHLHIFAANERA